MQDLFAERPTQDPASLHAAGRFAAWRAQAAQRWQALAARERAAVLLAAVVLGGGLLWGVALQPAGRVALEAPARIAALDAQLQAMHALAAEVRALRAVAPLPQAQAAAALQAATARLGPRARLTLQGERAVLNVEGVSPGEFQSWLAEARAGARARAVEAQLGRSEAGLSGTVVVAFGEP
jgi:general secretion pathway protein M